MAYALRYYKEFTHADGTVIRLEIHKKDSTEEAIEIGDVVQGLSLQIQGQQDDIDTPIQKTSVLMTFVDAPDIEDGRKNGFWEEFYTADATQWKVIIKERGAMSSSYDTIWGGYITPDSFSEDLVYRGSVSITARDNIGHMQDFPFDAEGDNKGMIKLWDLVRLGWAKIESPMSLDWHGDGNGVNWLYTEYGNILYDTLMNVSFFEDMNWYEAIEKALYSYGLVMRYVGRNRVHICPLRDLPKHGYHDYEYFATMEPVFVSGARRELAPAVKEIDETVDYELDDMAFEQLPESSFTGGIERFEIDGVTYEKRGIAWTIDKKESGFGWCCPFNSMFFKATEYEFVQGEDGDTRYNFLVCNTYGLEGSVGYRYAEYSKWYTFPATLILSLKFGQPYAFDTSGKLMPYYRLENVSVAVIVEHQGTSYYLQSDDSWDIAATSRILNADNLSMMIPASNFSGIGMMKIQIQHIKTSSISKGIDQYIPLYSAKLTHSIALREKNTVNTKYQEMNNVILSRDPEVGPAYDKVALPVFIKNGIFDTDNYSLFPPGGFRYPNGESFQLAVHIHKQLLCYHAKPNSVISGTIINSGMLGLACNWLWRGKEHILMSGNLNLLNGHMENAIIREFTRYEDMWND